MTGNEEGIPIFQKSSTLKICLNCSTPRQTSQLTGQQIVQLNCLFKLNYLTPFDSSRKGQDELLLCRDCQQLLNNLYQLYNNFLQICKIDSYLSRQLARLQEIIQSHQDKTIKCDLIVSDREFDLFLKQEDDDDPNSPFNQHDDDPLSFPVNCDDDSSSPENCELIEPKVDVPSTSTLIVRESRVLLERLPSKYVNAKTPSQNTEKSNDDDDQIKIEEDNDDKDDDFIPQDDDDSNYSEASFQNSKTRKIKIKSPPKNPLKSTRTKRLKVEDNSLIERIGKPIKKSSSRRRRKKDFPSNARFQDYRHKRFKYGNPCWYCKLHFDSIDLLLDHTRQEHLPQSQTCSTDQLCDRCARICTGDADLVDHLKKCELIPVGVTLPKEFMCHVCSQSFGTRNWLTTHLKTHSSDKPFACDLCEYKSKYIVGLKSHKRTHEISTQTFKCDECDVICKNQCSLRLHKYRKHTQKGLAIYTEKKKAVLARMKEERRLKSLAKSTICDDCNIDFHTRLAFINHRSKLHGDNLRQFTCDQCGQSFCTLKILQNHLRRGHSHARPILCQKCGKSYKDVYGLRTHDKLTHSEEGRLKHNKITRELLKRRRNLKAQLENKNLLPVNNLSQIQNSANEPVTSFSTTNMELIIEEKL